MNQSMAYLRSDQELAAYLAWAGLTITAASLAVIVGWVGVVRWWR